MPGQKIYTAYVGQPIFGTSNECWAYWAQCRRTISPHINFITPARLVGVSPFQTDPDPQPEAMDMYAGKASVSFREGKWIAGLGTVQKDFEHHDWFIMNPFSGPEAKYQAIITLFQCPRFRQVILGQNNPGNAERLDMLKGVYNEQRRRV